MIVTQHARYSALFQLLQRHGHGALGASTPLRQLEQEWADSCGLRTSDLHQALNELAADGCATQSGSEDETLVALTDRGMLKMNAWLEPLGLLAWLGTDDLSQRIHTLRILAQARSRQQTFRRSLAFETPSPIRDRRRLADRSGAQQRKMA